MSSADIVLLVSKIQKKNIYTSVKLVVCDIQHYKPRV